MIIFAIYHKDIKPRLSDIREITLVGLLKTLVFCRSTMISAVHIDNV